MRLFVAVWPPSEVLDALDALDRPVHPLVRWTAREQWHITLRFLGEVSEDAVRPALDALRAVGERRPPLRVELGPSSCRLAPSTLVVPVSGLDDLAGAVVEATRSLGAAPPARSFSGHVTLARSRRGQQLPARVGGQTVSASWLVEEMTLVRAHLDATGPRYQVLAAVPLAAA